MQVATLRCLDTQYSLDGSIKFLWQLADQKTVESIYFTFPDGGEARPFVCVSSQDGCNVGCPFCATGQQLMRRNLTADEIVTQVVQSMEAVHTTGGPANAFHVAFAGMGEPLLNYDQVIEAAAYLRSRQLAEIVSVSTAGIVPRIQDLAGVTSDSVNRLYISLHATTDELRDRLVPMNKKYPIAQLLQTARDYAHQTSTKVVLTYLLFADLNDTDEDLQRLLHLLDPAHFVIQLSVWNHIQGIGMVPSPHIDYFYKILTCHGYETFIQRSKGTDIEGGCGQLRAQTLPVIRLMSQTT